jgi:hypothetical protein
MTSRNNNLYYIFIIFLNLSFCYGQRLKTPTLSPFSKISQQVGLTEVTLQYSRPSAKGRVVFGELVPYDKVWRTGANRATRITFKEVAKIGGKKIQPGEYAIYTIPNQGYWTIIIHANTSLRSIAGGAYKPSNDVFRFELVPEKNNNYVETFTCQFSEVKTNSLMLDITWENTLISIPIEVEVDKKIESQMQVFMKNPEKIPHRTYFEAAQYYSNNGKDLKDALNFIDSALNKSPENFRYGLLKAKILAKMNNDKEALVIIEAANNWAKNKNNANYIEQTKLFWDSLLTKK